MSFNIANGNALKVVGIREPVGCVTLLHTDWLGALIRSRNLKSCAIEYSSDVDRWTLAFAALGVSRNWYSDIWDRSRQTFSVGTSKQLGGKVVRWKRPANPVFATSLVLLWIAKPC